MVQKVPYTVSTCSCTKCDSLFCFSKRHFTDPCSCNNCKESKTCLYYTNRLVRVSETHAISSSVAPIRTLSSATGDNAHTNYKIIPFQHAVDSTRLMPGYKLKVGGNLPKASDNAVKSIFSTQKTTIPSCGLEADLDLSIQRGCCDEPQQEASEPLTPLFEFHHVGDQIDCCLTGSNVFVGTSQLPGYDGYILELTEGEYKPSKNVLESCKEIFNSQNDTIEALCDSCVPQDDPCHCKKPEQMDSPGYIFDLNKPTACVCKESPEEAANPQGYIFELPKRNRCNCEESSKFASDAPGYILDPNNRNPCDCNESPDLPGCCISEQEEEISCENCSETSKIVSDPPGHVYDMPTDISCVCNEPKVQSDPPGHVYDMPTDISCVCNEPKVESNPPGHVYDMPTDISCVCNEPKVESDPPGHVYDMPTNISCDCNEPKIVSDPPGHVYDLNESNDCKCLDPKILTDPPGRVYPLKKRTVILQRKTTCECKEIPNNTTNPPGYVYNMQLGKTEEKRQSKHGTLIKATYQCGESKPASGPRHSYSVCVDIPEMNKTETRENSDPPNKRSCYCGDSQKSRHKPSKPISELCKNILDIQKSAMETLENMCSQNKNQDVCCEDTSNLPDCRSEEKQSHENKLELFKFMLETQMTSDNIQNETYSTQKNSCIKCDESEKDKADTTGFRLDSQKCTHETMKDAQTFCNHDFKRQKSETSRHKKRKCHCNKTAQKTTQSTGPLTETDNNKNESNCHTRNTQKICINFLETNRNAFDPLKNSHQKSGCECTTDNASDPPGYILGLEKYKQEEIKDKKGCECNTQKRLSDSVGGYILELQQYKNQPSNILQAKRNTIESINSICQKNCCDPRKRLSSSAGYILELDQYKNEPTKEISNNNTSQKKGCQCSESRKRLSSSAGYILDLDEYKHDTANKIRKLSKNIFDTQRNTIESLTNSCQKNSCECKESRKRLSSSAGYILDLDEFKTRKLSNVIDTQRNTIESLNNINNKKSCECRESQKVPSEPLGYPLEQDEYKHEFTTKIRKLSKNIFGIQRNTIESLKDTNKKIPCECNQSEKRQTVPESGGYIVELGQYKHHPSNVTQRLSKSLNTYQTKTCECIETNNNSDPPGFIFNLETSNEPINPHKLSANIFEKQRNTIESLTKTNEKKKCECSDSKRRPSESAGYIVELQQYKHHPSNASQRLSKQNTIESQNTCQKNSCACTESSKTISDPPGYILELDKYKNESPTNTNKKGCDCSGGQKRLSESGGYIVELQQYKNEGKRNTIDSIQKKSCECNEVMNNISDPGGFTYDLGVYKQEQTNNIRKESKNIFEKFRNTMKSLSNTKEKPKCACSGGQKRISESGGYIVDLQQCVNEAKKNTIESLNDANRKPKCECSGGQKRISGSAGYIVDLQQYINEAKKNTIESLNNVIQKPNYDCCGEQKRISEAGGYIVDLQQYINEAKKNTIESLNDANQKPKCECSGGQKRISGSAGYIVDLQQYINEAKKNTTESLNDVNQKPKCECSGGQKRISESGGYIVDLQQYINEAKKNTIESLNDANQKPKCECSGGQKRISGSAGYIVDLQQYNNEAKKNTIESLNNVIQKPNYDCCGEQKRISEAGGYIVDLQQYINEAKKNTIESLNDANQKPKCECSGGQKRISRSAGYIVDLQQYINEAKKNTNESLNDVNQKPKCECSGGQKRISESGGYIVDLQQYMNKTKRNTIESLKNSGQKNFSPCNCNELNNETDPPGYILELDNYKQETIKNTHKLSKNIFDAQINTVNALHNTFLPKTDTCNCNESSKHNINGPTKNALEVCKNIFETQINTIGALDNAIKKQCCDFIDPTKDPAEYANELTNRTQELCNNIYEIQKTTKEALNSLHVNDLCNCNTSSQNKSDLPETLLELHKLLPTKNILEMCKNILETQVDTTETLNNSCCKTTLNNKKTTQTQNVQEISKLDEENCTCTELQKNTTELSEVRESKKVETETTKENTVENQKKTLELCRDLQIKSKKAIETLKQIYLPPRYTLEITKTNEYPTNEQSDQPIKEVHSVKVSYSHTELTGTAMLSAEVMDMPYTDFHDSLARKQTETNDKVSKLSKYDIFKRIKEAYKACSCKVCECIIGKPTKNDLCQCKPCECDDCMSYLNKMDFNRSTLKLQCPCVRCNRGVCRGNEQPACDCKPCDCVKCTLMNFPKPCECEPCQCIECKPTKIHKSRMLVVAPVGENVQRVSCTCSPCDCIECGQGFPATSRTVHEMATGTHRHALCRCDVCVNDNCEHGGVDTCRCERRNRVMNKPVEKDTHDFDIRPASVVQKRNLCKEKKGNKRHDTIAMYAALPHVYPSFSTNKNKPSITKTCSCEECECIACVCKEHTVNSIKSSQLFSHSRSKVSDLNVHNKSKLNSPSNSNCVTCECEMYKHYQHNHNSHVSLNNKTSCMYKICDCIDCEGESRVLECSFNGSYKCSSYGCADCEVKMSYGHLSQCQCSVCRRECRFGDECPSNPNLHPVKRGNILTPSTNKAKVRSFIMDKKHLGIPMPTNKCETKCNAYIQCQERDRENTTLHIDNKISGSNCSGYSSFETSPKTSCHRDYSSFTPNSRRVNKSLDSSCNSSGHDYPEYLIQFPKSTVETCLKDVMKLDMDKTIKLDKFNIVSKKSTVKYREDSTSNENILQIKNLSQTQGCSLIDSCNCKTVAAKQTDSINQYENLNNCIDDYYYESTPWGHDFMENTSCCNHHFELNNQTVSETNRVIQTKQHTHHNHYPGCIQQSSTSLDVVRCKRNTENKKCLQILKDFNNDQVAFKKLGDITTIDQKSTKNFKIRNENSNSFKTSKQLTQFVGGINILNSDDDYKRVQKTLKEAKEHSLELMQLIKMYEKANNEFESISDKLKISHVTIFDDAAAEDDVQQKNVAKEERFIEIEHELQEIPLEVPSVREALTSTSIMHENIKIEGTKPENTFAECNNDINMITKKLGRTALYKDISNPVIVSRDTKTYGLPNIQNKTIDDIHFHQKFRNLKEELLDLNHDDVIFSPKNSAEEQITNKKTLDTKPKGKSSFHDTKASLSDTQGVRKKERINCRNHKKYSKLLKRTIIISKRISIKNSNPNISKPVVKYCVNEGTSTNIMTEINTSTNDDNALPSINNTIVNQENRHIMKSQRKREENVILRKLDSVFGSVEEVSVSASTDTYGLDNMSLYESENSSTFQELEDTKPWPILKKHYWDSKPCTKNKGVCIFPSLELQIKQACQSISLQTSSTISSKKKSNVPHHENKALANLQVEVKKLLDMPILQLKKSNTLQERTKESLNIQSKLDLELKETPGVSYQSSHKDVKSVDKEVCCSFTSETVESLLKDLLNLSVMELLMNEKIDEANRQIPKLCTPKNSCDSLKVGFLGVRRVSDHTVLVKWNVPRSLAKVHGYELLVDGRAVQKIFSPTKSMAVVTCLPHTDKVLLTIRTITSSVSVTGRYPASTIIYRPRAK